MSASDAATGGGDTSLTVLIIVDNQDRSRFLHNVMGAWRSEEFRVAAQLLAALAAPERRARTVDLFWPLSDYGPTCLPEPVTVDYEAMPHSIS